MVDPHHPVRALALWEPTYATPRASLRAIAQQLRDNAIGALLVPTEDGGVGIVSERDVVNALADGADPDEVWGDDVMSVELRVAHPQDPVVSVGLEMLDAGIRHVVLVEEGKAVGVVSMRDVLRPLVDAALTMRPAGQPAP